MINEPTDLVSMLTAVKTRVRKKVFEKVAAGWCTEREIYKEFGKKGRDALLLFEKLKLVETRWQYTEKGPEKAYHAYYSAYHLNAACSLQEMCEILFAAVMSEKEFKNYENRICRMAGKEGRFIGDIADKLNVSTTFLRSLIKRSTKLSYRGQRVAKY